MPNIYIFGKLRIWSWR